MAWSPFELGLGETRPSRQGMDYLQPADVDLSGFRQAFSALAGIGAAVQERSDKMENYKLHTALYDTKRQVWDAQNEQKTGADPSSTTLTQDLDTTADTLINDFLGKVPEHRREEFTAELAPYKFQLHMDAAVFQHESNQTFYKSENNRIGEQTQIDIANSPDTLNQRWGEFEKIVRNSGMDPISQDAFLQEWRHKMEKTSAKEKGLSMTIAGDDIRGKTQFFLERAAAPEVTAQSAQGLTPAFSSRLMQVVKMAEEATGEKAAFRELQRPPETQAQYYANYIQKPVEFEGKTYVPKRKGGLAAPPGRSRHQPGNAADLNDGKVLRWLRSNREMIEKNYGLEFLSGEQDIGHIQLKKSIDSGDAVSGSANSFRSLTERMIVVESGGDPNAVSNKGAAGIMQVMPDTARHIAKNLLGDENLPGTDKEIREYLKNPVIGRRYGEAYMEEQLKDFGGDMEAALIAYNAGPGEAQQWLKSGKDDGVLPAETRAYKNKILGGMGPSTSAIRSDPSYSTLTYEDWTELSDAWDKESKQQAATQKAEQDAQEKADYNRVRLAIESGAPDAKAQAEAWKESNPTADYQLVEQLNNALETRGQKVNALANGTDKLSDPTAVWSLTDENDKKMANAVFENDGGAVKLTKGGQEGDTYFNSKFMGDVNKTGMIPPDAAQALIGMAASGNYEVSKNGLNYLTRMRDTNPLAYLNGIKDEDTRNMVSAWDAGRAVAANEAELWKTVRGLDGDAATQAQYKLRIDTIDKVQKDPENSNYFSAAEALSDLGGGTLLELGTHGLAEGLFQQEVTQAYKDAYRRIGHGNFAAAKEAALQTLSATWGVTNVGGQATFMKYPPEKYLPQVEGNYRWIEDQARVYAASQNFALGPNDQVFVGPDRTTEDEFLKGQPLSYRVYAKGTDGLMRMVPGGWSFELTDNLKARQKVYQDLEQAGARQRRIEEDIFSTPAIVRPQDKISEDKEDWNDAVGQQEQLRRDQQRLQEEGAKQGYGAGARQPREVPYLPGARTTMPPRPEPPVPYLPQF